jgi:hypothetical protein
MRCACRVSLVADSESAEVVEVSKAALDDPALAAEAGAVRGSAPGDHWCDSERSEEPAVLVVVIATVGEEMVRLLAWPADLPGHGPAVEVFDQRDQLGDVVAVPASQPDREWDAARVDEKMVL